LFPFMFPLTGVALLEVKTTGGAIARLDEVLVSELGAAAGDQTSWVLGFEPMESGRFGLNSLALRNRGLLRGDEEGLPAERLKTAACGNGGEDVGEIEDEGIDIYEVAFACAEVTSGLVTGVCGRLNAS
jgi:hypothetical protein